MKKVVLIFAVMVAILVLLVGIVGCKGDVGPAGLQGPQGPQGIQGGKGDAGPQGSQGLKGDKGDKGEKGDKGDTGEQGARGLRGYPGATGATGPQGIQGEHGQSAPVLALIPKTGEPDWEIIDGQTGGILYYSPESEEFGYCLQAYGLSASTNYSLIYYADPWPGAGGCEIASGTADSLGNLFLVGEVDLGIDIPIEDDDNYPTGGKIWLVLSADYNGSEMTAWHPGSYLFEYELIIYIDTDD